MHWFQTDAGFRVGTHVNKRERSVAMVELKLESCCKLGSRKTEMDWARKERKNDSKLFLLPRCIFIICRIDIFALLDSGIYTIIFQGMGWL